MSFAYVDLECLAFLVSSIPSCSYSLTASSSLEFPEFCAEVMDHHIPIRVKWSEDSLYNVCLWSTSTKQVIVYVAQDVE